MQYGVEMKDVEELIEFSRAERRVCPRPEKWAELFKIISPSLSDSKVPPPLILASWWHTLEVEKRERLALHIRYAEETGKLAQVATFLTSLSDDEWTLEGEPR
jgi:hypothetical protein